MDKGSAAIGVFIAIVLLLAAIPYVRKIRDPQQKPVAAYLIFMAVLALVSALLFTAFIQILGNSAFNDMFGRPVSAAILIVIVLVPAVLIASWQAAKPPWRGGPPP